MKNKILKIFTMVSLTLVMALTTCFVNFNSSKGENPTRTIEISSQAIDYQSVLDDFDNAEITKEGSLTTFTGTKTISAKDLLNYDNVSSTDIDDGYNSTVSYHFSYDKDSNIVTISAEMLDENGEIYIDEISGVAFINANNEIDAVMNIDGESVLLSEMNNAGLIDNCGWFSSLIKKVVKVAVQVTVAVAVVAATAAVVVATAGAAAPALVAAGVGITTSTAVGAVAGVAAGALIYSTVGTAALKAGTAVSETIAEGVSQLVDKATGAILEIIYKGKSYATALLTTAVIEKIAKDAYFITLAGPKSEMFYSPIAIDRNFAVSIMCANTDVSVYTFNPNNARSIAQEAESNKSPILERATKIGYFDHYHTYSHGNAHAFFGTPKIK